ncbi:hypothetical protein [Palleronia rufa]|uniref:hypothetical protein n=1 Tax=Palleronia rufa TaxID=1530186 RepID=UPI000691C73B|nr:hypothetical protein [Palleronia rufa]
MGVFGANAALAAAVGLALAGCTPVSSDQLTRNAARAVVTKTLVNRYPGVPLEPALDCVIDNATTGELLGLASDSLTGPTEATAQTVLTISRRPGTLQCFAGRGMTNLTL